MAVTAHFRAGNSRGHHHGCRGDPAMGRVDIGEHQARISPAVGCADLGRISVVVLALLCALMGMAPVDSRDATY